MFTYYFIHVQPSEPIQREGDPDRYEMGSLCQSIYYHPDGILTTCRSQKAHYEIHHYMVPLPLWYGQWLHHACWMLIFCLDLLAH